LGGLPRAVAQAADIVITMVTDSAASEAVLCGTDGVLEGAHPGLAVIDMSSIAPRSPGPSPSAPGQGRAHAGCPGHRRAQGASEGNLGVMAGGPRELFDACVPLFEKFAAKIVYAGDNGMGTTLKLVNT